MARLSWFEIWREMVIDLKSGWPKHGGDSVSNLRVSVMQLILVKWLVNLLCGRSVVADVNTRGSCCRRLGRRWRHLLVWRRDDRLCFRHRHSRCATSWSIDEAQSDHIYDHTSHDSASVVRTTFKVYGKRQNLTLSQPKTPSPNLKGVIISWTPTTKNIWAQSAQRF